VNEEDATMAWVRQLKWYHWRELAVLDVYNAMLGAFLAVSPWLFAYTQGVMRTDAWITSAALIVLSLAAVVAFAEWEEWLNIGIGLWLIVSPWVLGFPRSHAMHISVAVGILVSYLAALELCLHHMRYSASLPGRRGR
jgi:SPW repeat-containing protein